MIRYRVAVLLLLAFNATAEDATQVAEEKLGDTIPPDKIILQKSEPYSQSGTFADTINTWLKNSLHHNPSDENQNSEDLDASATHHVGPQYLPPGNSRGYARSCYECNSEPWIPIAGRSLRFPPASSHSNSLDDTFKEKHSKQFSLHRPPIDQYGAPQGAFDFPPIGEVVDFMLPPPYKSGSIISGIENVPSSSYGPPPRSTFRSPRPLKPYFNSIRGGGRNIFTLSPPPVHQQGTAAPRPKALPVSYGTPSVDISAPPLVRYGAPQGSYGPPPLTSSHYGLPPDVRTTYLRPVSQDFQPPLPGGGIHTIPLENNLPPAIPSDSYGRPVTAPAPARPSGIYGAPHIEPITSGSGDVENNGKHAAANSQNHFFNINSFQKGLTDVQVVPSVRIADYTASIEHPINLIQSPILDLNVKDQQSINQHVSKNINHNLPQKLSENPIVVDDTYTSASNINTTYSAADNSSSTVKRHNDKFLSSKTFDSSEDKAKDADLTESLIKKLILEHNIIEDPKTQIVGIQKTIINPEKVRANLNVVQPSVDYSSWAPAYHQTISTVMTPPKPHLSTWLTPINGSFTNPKQSKKFQIIVPYLKAQHSTALFNRDYTTLAPVFVPPPVTTQPTDLWTQLVEEIQTVDSRKEGAHGFAKSSSTTEVYNIKDFLFKQQNAMPYDIVSLQKNIDDWTHQAYSNRYDLGLKLTTKLAHVKNIPGDYFTTTPVSGSAAAATDDNAASASEKKAFNDVKIEDNLILQDDTSSTTTKPLQNRTVASVRYIVRQHKPSWEENKVTFSNSTHEKVYVVTPQSYAQLQTSTPATAFSMAPRIQNGKVNNAATMTRISVHVEAPSDKGSGHNLKPVKVIYSEWPHLINNLETTTTPKPTTRHPLFGLMDLAPYTAPPNSAVETIGGHSKVTSVATTPVNKQTSTTPMPSTNLNETVKISPVT